MHPFENVLSVCIEDVEFHFLGYKKLGWAEFLLNPRRLRGSDFLMRWSQGVWSEHRLIDTVAQTESYFAIPYGPSGVAPEGIREFELYFERLEAAGLGKIKRPDLLIFRNSEHTIIEKLVAQIGGLQELPFLPESNDLMKQLLSKAVIGVECENSLWKAKKMPQYGLQLKPMKRLNGKLGLSKSAVVPTVIIKDEDLNPLLMWEQQTGIQIHIWHVFFDMAFGLALDTAKNLIETGKIEGTHQIFQAPGGATSEKTIYKIYYHYAYRLGEATTEPELVAKCIIDKNGHILPYVQFKGGNLVISQDAITVLDQVYQNK